MSWAELAAERSPMVKRSRARGVEQAKAIVEAAQRLITVKGSAFTTQELIKEAGIALQTFYRYFESKDQLILAVIEHMVNEFSNRYRNGAAALRDPIERLRFYVTSVIYQLDEGREGARFLATEHWRLQALYPEEVARVSASYTEVVQTEIEAAADKGLLRPADTTDAAWFVTQLVRGVFFYYAFTDGQERPQAIADRLWAFCLTGLAGNRPATNGQRPRRGPRQ